MENCFWSKTHEKQGQRRRSFNYPLGIVFFPLLSISLVRKRHRPGLVVVFFLLLILPSWVAPSYLEIQELLEQCVDHLAPNNSLTDPFQRQTPSWYAWWIGLDLSVWKSHPSFTSRCQSRTPQPVVWCEGHVPYDCDDAEQKKRSTRVVFTAASKTQQQQQHQLVERGTCATGFTFQKTKLRDQPTLLASGSSRMSRQTGHSTIQRRKPKKKKLCFAR